MVVCVFNLIRVDKDKYYVDPAGITDLGAHLDSILRGVPHTYETEWLC